MPWRQQVLKLAKMRKGIIPGDIYVFGIYSGASLMSICNYLVDNKIKICNIFGFDVFTGFPADPEEPAWQECWQEGNFNGVALWGMEPEQICSVIEKRVRQIFLDAGMDCNVKIFAGLVQDTLNDENLKEYNLKQCSYVDCDFDTYTPTKFALDYLVKKGLIGPNTIIGLDDAGGADFWWEFKHGETRAFKESIMDKNFNTELIFQSGNKESWCIKTNPHVQQAYVIKGNV